MIIKHIGPKCIPGGFPAEDLTPEYDQYHGHTNENDVDNAYNKCLPDNNDLYPLPTPEAGDNYISAEVLLPLGGVIQQGKVISCKCDADGNIWLGKQQAHPLHMDL